MRDKDLYAQILGIKSPWQVTDVELVASQSTVTVHVGRDEEIAACCPQCARPSPGYDSRTRRWRHLDTCQYKTILVAAVPRVRCEEHGVVTTSVPWAEPGSGFTALFEALVIDWLKEASISAVSRLMGLSWNAVDGIMQRAVARGLSRREQRCVAHLGVDETAFKKRHDYVSIVSDQTTGHVLHAGSDRKKATLSAWYGSLTQEQRESIDSISMDMWPAFINATLECVPEAEYKIAFDKFHVAKDPGRNRVANYEGVAAPRKQGARRENTLLYSTDEQRR
jgi:transposase